jgi:hypothetical protein
MNLAPACPGLPLIGRTVPKKALKLKYFRTPTGIILTTRSKKPTAVSDLLAKGPGTLSRLREGVAQADRTLAALRRHLPGELAQQAWGASLKDGTLTILVRSAAWGTRLRYLAPQFSEALAAELAAPVSRVKVKVRGPPR